MGKDRSKKLAIKWGTNFFCEKSPRGHVTAGIRGTPIRVLIEMSQEAKTFSAKNESYERTCQPDSVWAKEMDRIAELAKQRVRYAWDVWRDTGEAPPAA